jgi:hypothetical protein
MIRNLSLSFCAAAALLSPLGRADEVFPVVHNEPITVKILSGRDGQPQPQVRVVLLGGYTRRDLALGQWREDGVTDEAGSLLLSNGLRNLPLLRVEVLHGHACAQGAGGTPFSVELVRQGGLSGVNRCGFAFAENVAGVLTLYVKGRKPARKAAIEADVETVSSSGYGPDPVSLSVENLDRESGVGAHEERSLEVAAKAVPGEARTVSSEVTHPASEAAPLTDAEIEQLRFELP